MTKVIFDVSEELDRKLEQVMEKRQNSKAGICRFAITKFLEQELQNETKQNS